MAKQEYFYRYIFIIRKLQSQPYLSFEDMMRFLESSLRRTNSDPDKDYTGMSRRTFQRDIKDIKQLFGFEILFDRSRQGYYIDEREGGSLSEQLRILETMEIMTALHFSMGLKAGMLLEKRQAEGSNLLHELLISIEQRTEVRFYYEKYENPDHRERIVWPLILKEFRYRWYLAGMDKEKQEVRIYALDRIRNLSVSGSRFQINDGHKAHIEMLGHSYGITRQEGLPQQVVLSFTPIQGRYIKSLPLHNSQDIIIDNEQELRISLQVYISPELLMDLMSFGCEVQVMEPSGLAEQLKNAHLKAATNQ